MIVVMAGLPGSGKSTVAQGLSLRLPAVIISKDEIRTRLFRPEEIDYSPAQDAVCFAEMLRLTEAVLTRTPGQWVILDGRTFSRSRDVEQVKALADRLRQPLYVIRCYCSDEEARRRIEGDLRERDTRQQTGTILSISRSSPGRKGCPYPPWISTRVLIWRPACLCAWIT